MEEKLDAIYDTWVGGWKSVRLIVSFLRDLLREHRDNKAHAMVLEAGLTEVNRSLVNLQSELDYQKSYTKTLEETIEMVSNNSQNRDNPYFRPTRTAGQILNEQFDAYNKD